jgi:hypothetical protein
MLDPSPLLAHPDAMPGRPAPTVRSAYPLRGCISTERRRCRYPCRSRPTFGAAFCAASSRPERNFWARAGTGLFSHDGVDGVGPPLRRGLSRIDATRQRHGGVSCDAACPAAFSRIVGSLFACCRTRPHVGALAIAARLRRRDELAVGVQSGRAGYFELSLQGLVAAAAASLARSKRAEVPRSPSARPSIHSCAARSRTSSVRFAGSSALRKRWWSLPARRAPVISAAG